MSCGMVSKSSGTLFSNSQSSSLPSRRHHDPADDQPKRQRVVKMRQLAQKSR